MSISRWRRLDGSIREALLTDKLHSQLLSHSWPGNVRELRNVADRFVLGVAGEGMFRRLIVWKAIRRCRSGESIERALVGDAFEKENGDVQSATILGIPKQTLYDKIKRLGIDVDLIREKTG